MLAVQFLQAKFVVISNCALVEFLDTYEVYGMTTSEIDIPNAVPAQNRPVDAATSICSLATTTHRKHVDAVKSRIQCEVERYLRR